MTPKSDLIKAALWMVGAIIAFTAMAVAGRLLATTLDTFEVMMYRSMIGFGIVVTLAWATGAIRQVSTARISVHFLRNIFHFTGQNLWFFAIGVIPFAQVFALEFTTPLWVAVLAPIFLAEKMTTQKFLAVVIGFLGILLVANPGTVEISPGLVAAALCAVGFAGTAIVTKRLTKTDSTTCILFWLTLMQFGFGLLCAGYDFEIAAPGAAWGWVVVVGLSGLVAHYCITTALRLAPATIVMPLDFSRLPLIAVVGMVFFHEPIDLMIIAGAAVIFVANFMNISSARRQQETGRG